MDELLKLPEFSWEEIKEHTDAQSCWCVMNGLVYDLTNFLKIHPGGAHVIIELGGQDATDTFEDVGHTIQARMMSDEYIIGRVKGVADIRKCYSDTKECSSSPPTRRGKNLGASVSLIVAIVLVVLIGIWVFFYLQEDEDKIYHHFKISNIQQQQHSVD